jgi:hypothetical protein
VHWRIVTTNEPGYTQAEHWCVFYVIKCPSSSSTTDFRGRASEYFRSVFFIKNPCTLSQKT